MNENAGALHRLSSTLSRIGLCALAVLGLSSCGGVSTATGGFSISSGFEGPLSAMSEEESFEANQTSVETRRNATPPFTTTSGLSPRGTAPDHEILIDPDAGTVTITPAFGSPEIEFTGIDYTSGTTTFATSTHTAGDTTNELKILLPGAAASNLDWASYGVWSSHTAVPMGVETFQGEALSFGVLTPVNDMPVGGSATYQGPMDGFYVTSAREAHSLSGETSLTAAFNTGQVTGTIDNITTAPITDGTPALAPAAFGDINLTATISRNNFSGTASSPGTGTALSGEVQGSFYGPAAAEAGGVFRMDGTAGPGLTEHAVGSFAVRR